MDNTETTDTDSDGIGNNADTDDDGDGVIDSEDAFPLDNTETTDMIRMALEITQMHFQTIAPIPWIVILMACQIGGK